MKIKLSRDEIMLAHQVLNLVSRGFQDHLLTQSLASKREDLKKLSDYFYGFNPFELEEFIISIQAKKLNLLLESIQFSLDSLANEYSIYFGFDFSDGDRLFKKLEKIVTKMDQSK